MPGLLRSLLPLPLRYTLSKGNPLSSLYAKIVNRLIEGLPKPWEGIGGIGGDSGERSDYIYGAESLTIAVNTAGDDGVDCF